MWGEMAHNRYFSTFTANANDSQIIQNYLFDYIGQFNEYIKYTTESQNVYEKEIGEYSDDDYDIRLLN